MNSDEIQNAWNSPRNNLPTEQQQKLAGQFTRQMIRRRRFQAFWLVHTFVWLTMITGVGIWAIATGKTKLEQEWGLFPLLIVPWAFAFHFLRRYLKPVVPIVPGELPITDALRAAIASNRTQQVHLKLVGLLFIIMIPILALTVQQLGAAGKASAREQTSMAIFFGAILLFCGAGIAARYFGRLLPQQKQINTLLTELTNESQG